MAMHEPHASETLANMNLLQHNPHSFLLTHSYAPLPRPSRPSCWSPVAFGMSSDGLVFTFTKGIRAGVCVMATIGAISTFTVFLLLIHITRVTFIPIASNLRYLLSRSERPATTEPTTARVDLLSGPPGDQKSSPDNPTKSPISHHQAQAHRQTVLLQKNRMSEERMFLRMQLGVFIFCLLISDFVQALGVLIQARWAHLGGIKDGTACWVQAALITFGDVASGVWNAIIAIHTFSTICLGKRMSTPVVFVVVACGWAIPVLMNVIGAVVLENKSTRGSYYGVAGAWCFITDAYDVERALMHYVPMLVAAVIITLMYIPVFLTLRGNLLITASQSDWYGYRFTFRSASLPTTAGSTLSGGNSAQATYLRGLARKMLWYPIAYMIVLLPILICRFRGINGPRISLPVLMGCISLLFCMGISNVCIYLFTRKLGGTPWFARPLMAKQDDVEIFVERTTVNEAAPCPGGDSGLIKDSAGHARSLSTPWHLDSVRISPNHPNFSPERDLYLSSGAKAKEDEEDPPSPTSKHEMLHDLIFKHRTHSSLGSPNSELGGIRLERVGIYSHDKYGQQTFQDSLRSIPSVTTHDDPSG